MTTTAPTVIIVELPEPFDVRWSRLPGITIEGRVITIDPAQYFFRFDSSSWRICDWDGVCEELLDLTESAQTALEQISLDFIRAHGRTTSDPAEVLTSAFPSSGRSASPTQHRCSPSPAGRYVPAACSR